MPKGLEPIHKVIISGTGRSGTTFLVRLLTELGLDTGIVKRNWDRKYYEHCNAGLEHDLLDPKTPYIVKNPSLCETLPSILATGRFVIDHAYIPIRELGDATASRVSVGGSNGSVPGGLLSTSDPGQQRAVLAEMFHGIVHTLVANEIPVTFILFPRMVQDADYTRRSLAFLLDGITPSDFQGAFERVADPALVHSFGEGSAKIERAEWPRRRRRRLSGLQASLRGLLGMKQDRP
jgi:hypothetical protein